MDKECEAEFKKMKEEIANLKKEIARLDEEKLSVSDLEDAFSSREVE